MDLGEQLHRARVRRGWTQGDLARRLGVVEQQTVSRWERGVSRPRPEMISKLAQVLGIPWQEIASDIGHVARDGVDARTPARPLARSLPLLELPPERFEGFCKDLFRFLRGATEVHRYGGSGHAQHGIDLVVERPDGVTEVVQCKRHQRFGPSKVRQAVEATEFEADRYLLLLARDTASPSARDEMRRHHGWQLWDAEDVADAIRYELDPADAIRLVDTYFPNSRESFLGVPSPGPWIVPEEFFRPFQSSGVFHHERPLVGRHETVRGVCNWVDSEDSLPVGLVVGRGGIGKTRLLREVAEVLQYERGVPVRFLATAMEVTPASLEVLPRGRLALVIDDAHDRSDLSGVLHSVIRERPECRVLLALRPYGVPNLDSAVRALGLPRMDVPMWELGDLTIEEAEGLARSIVHDSQRAVRLASLTRDCPLITVLGAELIQRGSLDSGHIEAATDIRSQVLSAFREALTGKGAHRPSDLRETVLDLIALLQPLRTDAEDFRQLVTDAVDTPWDRVVRELRDLEATGILLRRGNSLRIVPDLLGDAILADAAFDQAGNSTGLAERVFIGAGDAGPRQHAFVNMIRVDWQVRDRRELDASPAGLMWRTLRDEFRYAGVRGRKRLLQLVARVSAFAPSESLDLVRWAINNPTSTVEELDQPYAALLGQIDYSDVLHELPPILRGVAYTFAHLPEICDLLWELAIEDDRPPNQHPQHALRVLQDLAEYQPGKPSAYNEVVLERAEQWLERGLSSEIYSPFDVLDPLLATEGADRQWSHSAITFQPFALRLEAVRPLRDQVIELALGEVVGGDLGRAVRATQTIGNALRGPAGLFGRAIPSDERERWDGVFVETLIWLQGELTNADLDPVVWSAMRAALNWHLRWSESRTRSAAEAVMALAPQSLEHHLTEALLDSWGERFDRAEFDYASIESQLQADNQELAQRLCDRHTTEEVVAILEERLEAISRGLPGKENEGGRFVWTLCTECPAVAYAICRRVLAAPATACVSVVAAALGAMAEDLNPATIETARALCESSSTDVVRRTAHALGWGRGSRSHLLDGELALLHDLAVHEDFHVRRSVAHAAQVIAGSASGQAKDLLLSIPFNDSDVVAEEVLGALARQETLSWTRLNEQQRGMLLSQLAGSPSLDDYRIQQALAELSAIHPEEVLKLLFARAERTEQSYADDYQALPFEWSAALRFREHKDFPAHLRIVRDWIARRPESGWRHQFGPDIFWAVARECDSEVERLLIESVEHPNPNVLRATSLILWGAPREWVLESEGVVGEVLDGAARRGQGYVESIQSGLHAAVISGGRVGAIGQPFKEDVEQKEKALDIAARLPEGSPAHDFYQALGRAAQASIESSIERDQKFLDPRDW